MGSRMDNEEVVIQVDRETFLELATQYAANRERWITRHGSDHGYNEWFTGQVFPHYPKR
jgi:hypothetical protein